MRRRLRSGKFAAISAFTLIEIVISTALMSVVLVAAYLCFSAAITSQKEMEPRLAAIQTARVALSLMTADLRTACPLDQNYPFLGMHRMLGDSIADNLDFATHNYTPGGEREGDYCQVSYFLNPDPENGGLALHRRRNPTMAPDPLSGGRREEIATGVLALQFEYYDGFDWYDTWGSVDSQGRPRAAQSSEPNMVGMPKAVRITLSLDPNPRRKAAADSDDAKAATPLTFQTIAHLNLASAPEAASGGSASPTTTPAGGGQTQPAGGGGSLN